LLGWLSRYTPTQREWIRVAVYGAMGACAILTNFGTLNLLLVLEVPLVVAGPVGYIVGGQANFFLHNGVTWRDRHPTMDGWGRRWVLFMLGNTIGLVINTIALLTYTRLGFPETAAFFAALATSAVCNWLWNNRIAFAHHPLNPPDVG
jgi:putative flippase GtrA